MGYTFTRPTGGAGATISPQAHLGCIVACTEGQCFTGRMVYNSYNDRREYDATLKRIKEYAKQLYNIAESQDGYFTAKQALASGYSDRMQTYHVQNGDWIRESRGIFRLASYPPVPEPELMVWYLWSCNRAGEPQSIYSHDMALQIYSLSSWNSQKLHMTVPPGFRRMVVPDVLCLHRKHLAKREIAVRYGVRVTKLLRTIVDLLVDEHAPTKYIKEALEEALDQNLILPGEIADADLTEEERKLFDKLRSAA